MRESYGEVGHPPPCHLCSRARLLVTPGTLRALHQRSRVFAIVVLDRGIPVEIKQKLLLLIEAHLFAPVRNGVRA